MSTTRAVVSAPAAPPPARPDAGTWVERAAPGLVVALAALTSLWRLGGPPLWYDEIATAHAASLPWAGLLALLHRTDANLGPYYLLMHGWRLLGGSAGWLRVPSAAAAVGTVALTLAIGRRLVGRRPALLAASLLAVHPFATAYAHDARPYALAACCCAAATLLGLRARERATTPRLAAYALVSTLAVAVHLYAALVVGVLAAALLPDDGARRRRWLGAQLPAAAAAAVLLAVSLRQQSQLHWVPPVSVPRVVGGTALLAGGALPLVALLVAAGVLVVSRRPLPDATGRRLLLGLLLVPEAALVLASLVRPTFVPRYLDPTVPAQCLVVAAALWRLRARPRRVAVAVVAVALAVVTAGQVSAPYRYEDYRGASRALLLRSRPGDAVVYADASAGLGMRYYLAAVRRPGQVPPRDALVAPGARWVGFSPAQLTGSAARRALSSYARTWLVDDAAAARRRPDVLAGDTCRPVLDRYAVRLSLCRPRA